MVNTADFGRSFTSEHSTNFGYRELVRLVNSADKLNAICQYKYKCVNRLKLTVFAFSVYIKGHAVIYNSWQRTQAKWIH